MSVITEPLLEVDELTVAFPTQRGTAIAVHGVSLRLEPGRALGIVGESGCGKSVLLRAMLGLVPPPGEVVGGAIRYRGVDVLQMHRRERYALRGGGLGMVFQDPTSTLDPVYSVGAQLTEALRVHTPLRGNAARTRATELLTRVGIPDPTRRMRAYPHQLSGGMRQRVMLALALAGGPRVLLADEPTTALDVTVQDQILNLLAGLHADTDMAMILVSHDLGVIARACEDVAVMYAGFIVERAPALRLFAAPVHPYTRALLGATPRLHGERPERLFSIPGQPPDLAQLPEGCPFQERCEFVRPECSTVDMRLEPVATDHVTACPFERGGV